MSDYGAPQSGSSGYTAPATEYGATGAGSGYIAPAVASAGYSAGYVPDILNTNVGITTAFSSAAQRAGVPERYDRSQHTLYLKFRDPAVKFCRGGVQGGTTQ